MRLAFRTSTIVRPIAFLVVACAFLFAWDWYSTAHAWHVGFPRPMGPATPLYANPSPIDLTAQARRDALTIAIAASVCSFLGIAWCVARRYSTFSCLLVALVGVWVTNVAVGYLRGGHASFVEPFARRTLEYHTDIPVVGDDPLAFIKNYPTLAANREISHHAGTHPPGGVLFLWAGQKLFPPEPPTPRIERKLTPQQIIARRIARLRSAAGPMVDPTLNTSVWLAVTFTAFGVLPAFWLAYRAGGAAAARRMLPLYVAAPSLILFGATSMDGVFLVFNLVALAAGVAAVRARTAAGGWVWPIIAGIALWFATFMTYASLAVVAILVFLTIADAIGRVRFRRYKPIIRGPGVDEDTWRTIAIQSHQPRPTPLRDTVLSVVRCATIGVVFIACQLLAQRAIGYDFRACAESAMNVDFRGLGITGYETRERWANLSIGNAVALLIGTGIAAVALVVVGLATWVRFARMHVVRFTLATLLALTALATSTLFSLETERVWLCLTPALLIGATMAYRGWMVWLLAPLCLIAQAIWIEVNYRTMW